MLALKWNFWSGVFVEIRDNMRDLESVLRVFLHLRKSIRNFNF